MRYQAPELTDRLAADYVLGTLTGGARRRFQTLLGAHPALRRQTDHWAYALAEVCGSAPPIAPPPEIWVALQARLFPVAEQQTREYRNRALWRRSALVSGLLAVGLAVVLTLTVDPARSDYVVLINDAQQRTVWLLHSTADRNDIYVRNLQSVPMAPGERCVLWLQTEGVQAVQPLGILPTHGSGMTLTLNRVLNAQNPVRLWVTVEPGDDTLPAVPSGRFVFRGDWRRIPLHTQGDE